MGSKKNQTGKVDNKDRILNSAMALIGEKGVEGTSLADIAKDVGISKGTLYYYYSTKNDLVFDIASFHVSKITENMFDLIEKNMGDVTYEEMLNILFTSLLKLETRTRLHHYLIGEILRGNDALKKRFLVTYRQWFSMMEEGFSMITNNKQELAIEARSLVAVIDGFIIQSILGIGDIQVDSIVKVVSRMIEMKTGSDQSV